MADQNFQISTLRLTISHLIADDDGHCDFLVNLYNTPEFLATMGGKPTSITTREAARQYIINRFYVEHARNGYGTYLFSLKPNTADPDNPNTTPIGTISLTRGEEPDDCYVAPDLGFAILSEYMRKGYAKEAAVGLMEWAEQEKGIKDVLGLHNPNNQRSPAVFKSLGFEDRGVMYLKVFDEMGRVWTKPGMARDLSVYGLPASGSDE